MAVLKSNAYGHGLLEIVSSIQNEVDYLAVFSLEDAIFLRKQGVKKPLLVMSRISSEQINLTVHVTTHLSCASSHIFCQRLLLF